MIKRSLNWFQAVKPNPTATDVMVQVGCHFEEVGEMADAITDVSLNYETKKSAYFFKNIAPDYTNVAISDFNQLELLDALCDQVVTAIGVGYMMGFDMAGALSEVCRSNESKFENGKPVFDANGKIAKGKNYTAPDLRRFLGEKK